MFKKISEIVFPIIKLITLLLLLFISPTSKFNTSFASSKPQSTTEIKTLTPKTLIVGTNATLKPFEYIDETTNKITGFDINFIKKIAENLGLKIKIHDMAFEALIPSVGSKIDIAIAAITKNPEREQIVNFSKPYYKTKQFVLTKNNTQIENLNQLSKLKIATQIGTSAQELSTQLLKDNNQNPGNLKTYNDYITMVNDLKNNAFDAIILDMDSAKIYQKMNSDELKVIDGSVFGWEEEQYCIACSKQNEILLNSLNTQIENLKLSPFFENLINKFITNNAKTEESKLAVKSKPNTNSIKNQFETAFLKNDRWQLYLNGFAVTMQITLFAAILGLSLGVILALAQVVKINKCFKIIKILAKTYVDLIRGTPLILQLFILWFIVLKNFQNAIMVAIIAFGLNSAAYVCEIVRGAINAIDRGQTEAGLALGLNSIQTLTYIVLPQGLKNSIPALCNEIVSLLKETAVVGYIAIVDLTRAADLVRASTYQAFMPLIIVAIIYFIITKTASFLLNLLERKLSVK